jgi:hypothetical protein
MANEDPAAGSAKVEMRLRPDASGVNLEASVRLDLPAGLAGEIRCSLPQGCVLYDVRGTDLWQWRQRDDLLSSAGSILGGLILGAIAVCIIDRNFMKAAGFALAGAILTFFGFMHGHQIGIAHDPSVAFSYLIVAVIFAGCAKLVAVERPREVLAHGEALPQPAE